MLILQTGFTRGQANACFACLWRDRRGVTAMTFATLSLVLLGFVSLGTEVGAWYLTRASVQSTADAAAVAAAVAINANPTDFAGARAAGQNAAERNGYTDGATVVVTTNIPPATGVHAGDPHAAEAIVSVQVSPLLTSLFASGGITIARRAVATILPISPACVLTTSGDLTVSQGQDSNLCAFVSNAADSTAINILGVAARQLNVYAFSTSGDCSGCPPAANYYSRPSASLQPPVQDPYIASIGQVSLPTRASVTCLPSPVSDPDFDLVPAMGRVRKPWAVGTPYYAYCADVVIPAGKNVRLAPGVYYFIDAALTVRAGATMQCSWDTRNDVCDFPVGGAPTGVTFVFTGTPATVPTLKIDPAAFLELSAPAQRTTDPRVFVPEFKGVLFYRDGHMPPGAVDAPVVDIQALPGAPSGGVSLPGVPPTYTVLNGLLYFPNAAVSFGANGVVPGAVPQTTCSLIVAGTIAMANYPAIFEECTNSGYTAFSPQVLAARLVE